MKILICRSWQRTHAPSYTVTVFSYSSPPLQLHDNVEAFKLLHSPPASPKQQGKSCEICDRITVVSQPCASFKTVAKEKNRICQRFYILTMIPGLSFLQIVVICRTAQFFMHYFVGANYFWLLVEGIYLHTLLITVVLSERRLLQTYIVIGWGKYITNSKFLILWYIFESVVDTL